MIVRPPTLETPVHTPAPGWSKLAARRAATRNDGRNDALVRLARRARASVAVATTTAIVLTLVLGWVVMMCIAVVMVTATLFVQRRSSTRRWLERQRASLAEQQAIEVHTTLVAQMLPEHATQLARLSSMVETVRDHERRYHDRAGLSVSTPLGVAPQLDAALLAYVDRVIELRSVRAAFFATERDEPRALRPRDSGHESTCPQLDEPTARIVRLRTRAREGCRRRIRRLERERETIAQLVYLIHEQTLASGLPPLDPSDLVTELLEEAELAREVHDEAGAVLQSA